MKLINYLLIISSLLLTHCNSDNNLELSSMEKVILTDTSSFFYVDTKNYPVKNKYLPIGIFDSGTGGLTVMDAIINFDGFNNISLEYNSDSVLDFEKEYFIYLADQANMPYGNYPLEGKTDLLKEHIIKDMQFLLGNKYYQFTEDKHYQTDKRPVKAIIIACNTATAFELTDIESFLQKADLNIKVIGVINAGVKGAFENILQDENFSIAVIATEGTVLSKGYVNAIIDFAKTNGHSGDIHIFQQTRYGLAGVIDGVVDYISSTASTIREEYKGPSFTNSKAKIDKSILSRYNFDWKGNKILFSGSKNNPAQLQLNSIENYIYYNVVSLLEQIKNSESAKPLKTIILGGSHYPFYCEVFNNKLKELYNLKENGDYVYRHVMSENIVLINPAVNTAKELFKYLKENKLFNKSALEESEFYISLPNVLNEKIELDQSGNFTYI